MAASQIALWTVLALALATSVVTDVVSRRIPDWVTWPTVAIALGIRFFSAGPGDLETGLLSGVVAAAGAMGLLSALAWRGSMGWGDVKLVGAVGAVFGYPAIIGALVFISLVGAVQAVVTLIWQGQVWETLSALGRRVAVKVRLSAAEGCAANSGQIPYGVAIALGSFWAMWWTQASV
jgi:prepilin peptidase CpaA